MKLFRSIRLKKNQFQRCSKTISHSVSNHKSHGWRIGDETQFVEKRVDDESMTTFFLKKHSRGWIDDETVFVEKHADDESMTKPCLWKNVSMTNRWRNCVCWKTRRWWIDDETVFVEKPSMTNRWRILNLWFIVDADLWFETLCDFGTVLYLREYSCLQKRKKILRLKNWKMLILKYLKGLISGTVGSSVERQFFLNPQLPLYTVLKPQLQRYLHPPSSLLLKKFRLCSNYVFYFIFFQFKFLTFIFF